MEECSSSSTSNLSCSGVGVGGKTATSTISSPLRTIQKFRLYASVSDEDVKTKHCHVTEHGVQIEGKNYSKSIFDHIFRPDSPQEEFYTSFLGETIKSVINGNDATILAMGAKSNGKDERLYGDSDSRNGIVQMAIAQLMSTLEAMRSPEERFQVRMSAVMVSQKDSSISDLLSPFNPDPRHRVVKINDDPRSGVFLDNETEIRVESVEEAMFYLNTAVDHRLIQDEQAHRTSHILISLSLYCYKMSETQMQGGRRRLCFLDMGIGERNSTNGGMTMPALGSILLAMIQRNKHIPSRDSSICQLIRCALSSSRFTTFVFSFGAKNDDNENIAHLACKIARTRSKNTLGHVKKSNTAHSNLQNAEVSTCSSSTDTRSRRDLESGSEMSAAETVIFLGPSSSRTTSPSKVPSTPTSLRPLHRTNRSSNSDLSGPLTIDTKSSPTHSCHSNCVQSIPPMLKGHTPFLSSSLKLYDELCSPPGTSAGSPSAFGGVSLENRNDFGVMIAVPSLSQQQQHSKAKMRYNLDDGKRKQIMQWMETSESPPILFSTPCYDMSNGGNIRDEPRECGGILSHPLEDIIELEEESMRTSTATTGNTSKKEDHPLRILSKQNLVDGGGEGGSGDSLVEKETNGNGKEKESQSTEENELELVMAASLSSMKSHDILAKLEAMRNTASGVSMGSNTTIEGENYSEMDVYRRASHLEEYAMQRVREIEDNKQKKKKVKLGLNCCQQSMVSSGSTVVDWSQIEKKKELERGVIEEEKRKEILRERRARLKITELEIKKERSLIDKELDDKRSLANSIARQLQHFSLSPCRSHARANGHGSGTMTTTTNRSISMHRIDPPMTSLPSTPTMSHRKITSSSFSNRALLSSHSSAHQSLPRQTKVSSSSSRSDRKASKSSSRSIDRRRNSGESKERKSSKEELCWRSPYSHMTSPKTYGGPGTSSSGRGSSAPGSDFDTTGLSSTGVSLNGTELKADSRKSKRQSYSASSGYESATNDYHIYTKSSIFDKKANEELMAHARQADEIRHRQRQLKKELEEAKRNIGQIDDARALGNTDQRMNGLSRTTMIDTLLQENRILEKRILACRNHAMLVTTFI